MKIKEASAAQAVGVAILAARHPGPGQGSEAPGKLAGPPVQDPGQWGAHRRSAAHLVDDTFCIAPNFNFLLLDPKVGQGIQAIDQSQVFRSIRACLAVTQEDPEAACHLHAIMLYQPAVAKQTKMFGPGIV